MSSIRIQDKKEEALARNIFDSMWASLSVNADGHVNYDDQTPFNDLLPILNSLLVSDKIITSQEKAHLISASILNLRKYGHKKFDKLLPDLNVKIGELLSRPKRTYYLSTTVSLYRHSHEPKLAKMINNTFISIRSDYPKKLRADEWFLNGFGGVRPGEPQSYARLYGRTTARTRDQAARTMLSDIELLLGCLSIYYNSNRRMYVGEPKPISDVRLGRFQLTHDDRGKIDHDKIWYELAYEEVSSPKSLRDEFANIRVFVDQFFIHLRRSPIRTLLESSLRQWSAALNMKDPQLCLLRLWSSLETLMKTGASGSKITAKRASFFARHHEHQRIKLEYIAEVRNAYVHGGTEVSLIDPSIQSLKVYVAAIIRLLVFGNLNFKSEEEYIQLLELPPDPFKIEQRVAISRLGLKLRRQA